MSRKRTNGRQKPDTSKTASPQVMLNAMMRANAKHHTSGYFYGNMGDSIERRYNGGGDGGYGGGNDAFQGVFGNNSAWQAQGYGNYFGTGLLNGYGRMFSGVHGGYGGGFTYLRRFSSNAAFNHQVIASCMMAYFGYGVVRNIVDLYADLATEGLEIEHTDESVRNFYQTWAKKIKLNERVHSMFINLFVSGNVFVHRRWAKLDEKEKRAMKKACGAEIVNGSLLIRGRSADLTIDGREGGFIDWYLANNGEISVNTKEKAIAEAPPAPSEEGMPKNPEQRIPWGYTYLNPLQMELRGRRLRGDSYWIMAVDKKDALDIARGMGLKSGYNQDLGVTEFNLPKEFLSRIQAYQGPGAGYAAEVKLSDEELRVVQAPGKFDWFDWAIPFVFPALKSLAFKDGLRDMECKAMQSVINSVFLFKLGNIKDGMPCEDEHVERLADMLQMPGQAMNIIWNEAIEAEVIQADTNGLFDSKKHESADRDILTALGVPEVLLGGKGGNFSNSYIGVAGVLERLESYRNQVYDWLMGELKIIADAMSFQKLPTIKFGRTSLKDEKAYQTFLTGLYDRGILSADTLLHEAETIAEVEAAKMKEEKEKYKEKDIFEPRGPFVKDEPPPGAAVAPPGGGAPKSKPKTPNGRPPGTDTGPTGKQAAPRAPVGQGVAEILEAQEILDRRGRAMLEKLEEFISGRLMQAKAIENPNLKHVKSLRAQEKERLEWLIYNVFSHMPPPQEDDVILEEDYVINMLRSSACEKVKAEVLRLYTDKVAEYSKTYGKVPTREMRRQFMVSAWTQTAILEHLEK